MFKFIQKTFSFATSTQVISIPQNQIKFMLLSSKFVVPYVVKTPKNAFDLFTQSMKNKVNSLDVSLQDQFFIKKAWNQLSESEKNHFQKQYEQEVENKKQYDSLYKFPKKPLSPIQIIQKEISKESKESKDKLNKPKGSNSNAQPIVEKTQIQNELQDQHIKQEQIQEIKSKVNDQELNKKELKINIKKDIKSIALLRFNSLPEDKRKELQTEYEQQLKSYHEKYQEMFNRHNSKHVRSSPITYFLKDHQSEYENLDIKIKAEKIKQLKDQFKNLKLEEKQLYKNKSEQIFNFQKEQYNKFIQDTFKMDPLSFKVLLEVGIENLKNQNLQSDRDTSSSEDESDNEKQ